MKNKILAMLVAFGLVGSVSAIEINENLSINGFIDGSAKQSDPDTGAKSAELGLDEVEVNFLFNVGSVSGELHVDSNAPGAGGGDSLDIEQAHFTYSLENGVSFTLGRYGRAIGLEREDPAGLYTVSRAYNNDFNLGDVDNNVVEGITVSYAAEAWAIGVSIENAASANLSANDADVAVAIAYTGVENLNLGLGYLASNEATAAAEVDVTNVNATYVIGKALLGAEYTQRDTATADLVATMYLVDYDVSDKLGVALRYSSYEATANADTDRLTIAPNYALTESLGAILEYSDINVDGGVDSNEIALELTYTF
ncbi:porin [Verrucomicrobia bacterium]|nr:porin [Verrucomicrobiota bacterium]